MSRKANMYNQVLNVLKELHKTHPHFNMGRHLSTALDGYGDVWGVTDKELLYALEKYKNELEFNKLEDIEFILKDGADLDNMLMEEDNGEDF